MKTNPVDTTTAWAFDTPDQFRRWKSDNMHLYSRISNPTISRMEEQLAALEPHSRATIFSSGMGAITTLLIGLRSNYDIVITTKNLYGGTKTFFSSIWPALGGKVIEVDGEKELIEKAKTLRAIIFIETPSNPYLDVFNVAKLSEASKQAQSVLVVDNSICTPFLQPLIWTGADFVVASATKGLSGHGDVMSGVVWQPRSCEFPVTFYRTYLGNTCSPETASRLYQQIKTGSLRLEKQTLTAHRIAAELDKMDALKVYHPSLNDSDDLFTGQMRGFGGPVLSFELTGGLERARTFLTLLKRIEIATSFGGLHTTIQLCNDIEYKTPDGSENNPAFTNLIRMSVGIEDHQPILEDINEAMAQSAL